MVELATLRYHLALTNASLPVPGELENWNNLEMVLTFNLINTHYKNLLDFRGTPE